MRTQVVRASVVWQGFGICELLGNIPFRASSSSRQARSQACLRLRPSRYCEYVQRVPAFDGLTLGDISSCLRWKLGRKRDENGRKPRGLSESGSLMTDGNHLRLVYERAMGMKIDG
jgi:hypothetical protein